MIYAHSLVRHGPYVRNIVELDNERNAALVNNPLVLHCGHQRAQPTLHHTSSPPRRPTPNFVVPSPPATHAFRHGSQYWATAAFQNPRYEADERPPWSSAYCS